MNRFLTCRLSDAPGMIGLAMAYALLTTIPLTLFSSSGFFSIINPASGLGLAALIIGGRKYWPSVFAGTLAGYLLMNSTIKLSLPIALGNTLEALFGVWLLIRSKRFDSSLSRTQDLPWLGFAAISSSCISAMIGIAVSLLAGIPPKQDFAQDLLDWWQGDVLGIMLVTPLILVWRKMPQGWFQPKQLPQTMAFFTLFFLSGQIILMGWLHDSVAQHAKGFMMFVFVVWGAVNFGRHGVLLIALVATLQSLSGALQGTGYFGSDITETHLDNFWFYMLELIVVGMSLALINNEREHAIRLVQKESVFRKELIESLPGIFYMISPHGRLLMWNKNLEAVTRRSAEDLARIQPADLFEGSDRILIEENIHKVFTTGATTVEASLVASNNNKIPYQFTGHRIERNGEPVLIGLGIDITERKLAEEKIFNLAFYDALTSLPNRRLFLDRFNAALPASARRNDYGATLFIDLDHFKALNDTLGHEYGDLLLKEVGGRIKSCVREMDTVARFGGDEFVVLIEAISNDREDATRKVALVAEKIRASLAQPYKLKENGHLSSPSIGGCLFHGSEEPVDTLLEHADMAMYQAKNSGRNAVRFYDPARQ
ncbi:MAG: diguanylate cyclase [Nitrosomonadales bacterium]|nr:diguanylate cyclase [Nitrosomonadales bacterium]